MEIAMFGAGCFWGVEAEFRKKKGVLSTAVGYCGGNLKDPTYEDVCKGTTGHAEVVRIEYNPEKIKYTDLLITFWQNHNPTTLNRQGPDVGTQYRSIIFYTTEAQKKEAINSCNKLEKQKKYNGLIVTEIEAVQEFYIAEDYHQQYLEKRGMASCHI